MPPEPTHETHWTRDAVLGLISLVVLGAAVLLGVQIAKGIPAAPEPAQMQSQTQESAQAQQVSPQNPQDTQAQQEPQTNASSANSETVGGANSASSADVENSVGTTPPPTSVTSSPQL